MVYAIMHACERLDPRSVWGRPFVDLTFKEQARLVAYDNIRGKQDSTEQEN